MEQRRLLLAQGLNRDEYEHVIITQAITGSLPERLRAENWALHEIGLAPHILSPGWHAKAYDIAREFGPDIIHGAVFEGVALANVLGWRMPGVRVISEETSDPVNRSWRGNLLMRGLCLRSDLVVAVSPAVGGYLRTKACVPGHKIRVVDNAVMPPPQVKAEELHRIRDQIGLRREHVVIGSVGRLFDEHKRFNDLLRAFATVCREHPSARLLLVGDGPDRSALEALAHELGLSEFVVFAGYQGEARKFYPLMDIFVLASAHEAFGLVLVEAMMAGVPVVATRVGGMPYVLQEGAAGRLVPPLAPNELAREILSLCRDPAARSILAAAGKQRAEQSFSADRYCRQIDALYRELVP